MNPTVPTQQTRTTDDGPLLRIPPQDLDAERCVLGAMLLSRDAIGDVVEILAGPDFYRPVHETLFTAIVDLFSKGEPVDPITVSHHLERRGDLDRVGGPGYVHSLVGAVPTAANAGYYADIVEEKAALRRLATAGTRIADLAYSGEGEVTDLQDAAAGEFNAAILQRADTETTPLCGTLDTMIDRIERRQRGEKKRGVPTGFLDLDTLTGGWHPGQMIIVAARPAVGKSTLALDFARAASLKHGLTTAFFSLEMGREELQDRCLAAEAQVALNHINTKGGLDSPAWDRIATVAAKMADAPLLLDESANTTVAAIKAKCRRIQQQRGLDLVVIDYLQLLKSGGRAESRQVEVSEMSRAIKIMAKDLGVPVIVLSQLNRGPEQRTDKKPVISDLRESGSLEQDADLVILLHREDAYDKESPRAGETDLIVAKHRGGPTTTITVAAQLHYARFVNMENGF